MENFYVPKRAMAIVAHPDDIEFSCAGTLARWAKHGCLTSYVLCTSGEVGIAEPGMTKEKAKNSAKPLRLQMLKRLSSCAIQMVSFSPRSN